MDATTEATIESAIDTLANLTAASALVTVGALNSGSITSGFGNIDNGSSTLDTGIATVASMVCTAGATFGGGYGSTGVSISTAGVIQANGNIETSSSFVIGSASMDETDLEKLDGITNGTAAANKAVVLEGSKNIATLGTVGCGAITSTGTSAFGDVTIGGGYGSTGVTVSAAGVIQANGNIETASSFVIGSASMDETDLEKLDGITNGTAAANKAVVLEGSKNIATLGTVGCGAITSTGDSTFDSTTLVIDSSNNRVGIGTGSPGTPLHVANDQSAATLLKVSNATASSLASAGFSFTQRNAADSGTFAGALYMNAADSTLYLTNEGNGLTVLSSGKVGVGIAAPTGILHVKSAANLTESGAHIQIEGSGYGGFHFLDATAYYIGQNSAGRTLRLYSSAETAGAELAAGGTSFGTFSDERVKTGVVKIENAVSNLLKLRCVKFNYKMDPETQGKRLGLIAQDLLGVFDEAVYKGQGWGDLIQDDNEYYSVTYTDMIPPIIAAIQELSKKIDAL